MAKVQSVEPNIADLANGWLKSYRLPYKLEQESLNTEIDQALNDYASKSGGAGGNRPDAKLLLQDKNLVNYPILIEYKGYKDKLVLCALPGFVDSKNEEKTERNAGYLVVSHSGGGMLRQGTRKGIRRTPANRGMRAHRIVKSLDISEDVCHGLCP